MPSGRVADPREGPGRRPVERRDPEHGGRKRAERVGREVDDRAGLEDEGPAVRRERGARAERRELARDSAEGGYEPDAPEVLGVEGEGLPVGGPGRGEVLLAVRRDLDLAAARRERPPIELEPPRAVRGVRDRPAVGGEDGEDVETFGGGELGRLERRLVGPGGLPASPQEKAGEDEQQESGRRAAGDDEPPGNRAARRKGRGGPRKPPARRAWRLRARLLPPARRQELLQLRGQVAHRRIPVFRGLRERRGGHLGEPREDARLEAGNRPDLEVEDRVHDVDRGLPLERRPPREELVEDRPEGEDVAAGVGPLAARLLRRHVLGRADDETVGRQRRRALAAVGGDGLDLREAEVEDPHAPLPVDHDVRGLDVAVEEPGVVDGGEPLGRLHDPAGRFRRGDRPGHQDVLERLPFDELLDEVRGPLVLAHVEDLHEVRVGERGHDAPLVLEAEAAVGRADEVQGERLQGDDAAQRRVLGPIDLPHRAGADRREDPVAPDERSGGDRRGHIRAHGPVRRPPLPPAGADPIDAHDLTLADPPCTRSYTGLPRLRCITATLRRPAGGGPAAFPSCSSLRSSPSPPAGALQNPSARRSPGR